MSFIGPKLPSTMSRQFQVLGLQPKKRQQRKKYGPMPKSLSTRPSPLRTGGFPNLFKRSKTELKFLDVSVSNLQFNSTGTIRLLNGIVQGTDYNQRIGRQIILKSIYLRMYLFPNAAATNVGDVLRIILGFDEQPNGALPIVTDILTSASTTAANNLNNRDRFKILVDKTFPVGQAITANAVAPIRGFKKVYKKCNWPVTYSGTTADIASLATGSLFILTVSENVAGITCWDANYHSRIRFTDS
nr:capsid protein [Cressdnaviricota sp.]